MRKKLVLLALSFAALTGALLSPRAKAGGNYSCPQCTYYPEGGKCCVSCLCDSSGQIIACTNHYCPPAP